MIDKEDVQKRTALMCAVENANINWVKCLIANGADLNVGHKTYPKAGNFKSLAPIIKAIWLLRCPYNSSSVTLTDTSVIMTDIFDLLLEAEVEQNNDHFRNSTDYIHYAIRNNNVNCIKKLINKGAPFDVIGHNCFYVWEKLACKGDVGLLKCMINRGFDKDSTDQDGVSVLCWVVRSCNIEAVRYLLGLGVRMPTYAPEVHEIQCEQCKENKLILDDYYGREERDPCMAAIDRNNLEIVKLLEEYGSQTCKSFDALRCALKGGNVDVVSYLLKKYTYPLNMEYITNDPYEDDERMFTLLSERFYMNNSTSQITKLLLDQGADPAKPKCPSTSTNAIMRAITHGKSEPIAQYIRSGVNINCRSYDFDYGNILPFEASVLHHRHYISVMLLSAGCSRGMFSNHMLKANPEPDLEKLMKEWNVYENDVTPLQLRCRSVILNHLSPRADVKVEKLPLPPSLIKFLSVPELDNILYEYNKPDRD